MKPDTSSSEESDMLLRLVTTPPAEDRRVYRWISVSSRTGVRNLYRKRERKRASLFHNVLKVGAIHSYTVPLLSIFKKRQTGPVG